MLFPRNIYCIVFMCLLLGCIEPSALESPLSTDSTPGLLIEGNVNLGEVLPGEVIQRTVSLKNNGNEVLSINDIKTSCGCTVASCNRSRISPGEEALLNIQLSTPSAGGEFAHSVTILTSPTLQQSSIVVQGIARNSVEVQPALLTLTEASGRDFFQGELRVFSPTAAPLDKVEIDHPNELRVTEKMRLSSEILYDVHSSLENTSQDLWLTVRPGLINTKPLRVPVRISSKISKAIKPNILNLGSIEAGIEHSVTFDIDTTVVKSDNFPADLKCILDGSELRVEVNANKITVHIPPLNNKGFFAREIHFRSSLGFEQIVRVSGIAK